MEELKIEFKEQVEALRLLVSINRTELSEIPLEEFDAFNNQLQMLHESTIRYSEVLRLYEKLIK